MLAAMVVVDATWLTLGKAFFLNFVEIQECTKENTVSLMLITTEKILKIKLKYFNSSRSEKN